MHNPNPNPNPNPKPNPNPNPNPIYLSILFLRHAYVRCMDLGHQHAWIGK